MDGTAPASPARADAPQGQGLSARLRAWRNRMIGSDRFQRMVARVPLLRGIARRNARDLFRLNAGFLYTQVLLACVELRLFDTLKAEGSSEAALAAETGLSRAALARLLTAAQGLKLITRLKDGTWWLDDLGAVVAHNPGIAAMIRHHAMVYRDLADPVALLRSTGETETSRFWAYAGQTDGASVDPERAEAYSRLMHLSQDLIAAEVLSAYDFARHRTLLDIGGGDGTFLAEVAKSHPDLALWLFDLPPVAAGAETAMAARGLETRTRTFGGSFFDDPLPVGADCLSLVRVLCDHDDPVALALLKAAHTAMRDGDVLVIAEPMGGTDDDRRFAAAYFEFYFLAMRSGHCRTPEQIATLLRAAGFTRIGRRRTAMPLFTGVMTARV